MGTLLILALLTAERLVRFGVSTAARIHKILAKRPAMNAEQYYSESTQVRFD
jgi:hypothetical protein